MNQYSKKDIIRLVQEEDVEFIRLQFTDMFGVLKNVAITASQLEKALNNKCMFDGSAIDGFVRIEECSPGDPSRERWPECFAMCIVPTEHPLKEIPGTY